MKKIFLDTNFICDYFIREEYFTISEAVIKKANEKEYTLNISYLSVANFAYIIRKEPSTDIYFKINNIISSFNVLPNNKAQIERALKIPSSDFEDGLQYQAALAAGCDVIITRNKKDFSFSEIPVMTPQEFLEV